MSTPHIHAELIKAWADGAEIEYLNTNHGTSKWRDIEHPFWGQGVQYRIKQVPKPKITRWLWAWKFPQDNRWTITTHYATEQEFKSWIPAKGIKLKWSAMEFDE